MSEFKAFLRSANGEEKALAVSRLINNLTISARTHYGEEDAEEKLRRINEVMHVASGKLRDVLSGTSKQYPDDVFVEILFEAAGVCESDLASAVGIALERSRV
jgi:hypothetical protein